MIPLCSPPHCTFVGVGQGGWGGGLGTGGRVVLPAGYDEGCPCCITSQARTLSAVSPAAAHGERRATPLLLTACALLPAAPGCGRGSRTGDSLLLELYGCVCRVSGGVLGLFDCMLLLLQRLRRRTDPDGCLWRPALCNIVPVNKNQFVALCVCALCACAWGLCTVRPAG